MSMISAPVIVVSGLPRSGTSLVMQMLEAAGVSILSDGARVADEDNPRGYFEYEPVKRLRQDRSWLPKAAGQAVKIIHLLVRDLPLPGMHYRVLWVQRELKEVLASQKAMLQRSGRAGAGIPEAQLEAVFALQIREVEAWLEQQPEVEMLRMDYGHILAQPQDEAARIASFLGCPERALAMAAVVDPALHRNKLSMLE